MQHVLPCGTSNNSSICMPVQFFDPVFEADFGGLLVLKMGHAGYRWKA